MSDRFDGVVLGTGHNALVLQAYLCRAGLRVLSVDRAQTPGGGLSTLENPRHRGFLHNTHSFFHRAITAMPWYGDLELERHGARFERGDDLSGRADAEVVDGSRADSRVGGPSVWSRRGGAAGVGRAVRADCRSAADSRGDVASVAPRGTSRVARGDHRRTSVA